MENFATDVAKNEIQNLVNLVKREAKYLCCYSSYAREFDEKKSTLKKALEDVSRTIDKASGVSYVTSTARGWKEKAEELVAVDTKKEKCFNGLCLNCWRLYGKGRELAKQRIPDIDNLLVERDNLHIVDGPVDLPGLKFKRLPNFMHFESRKSKHQELKEALECEENNMIVLVGPGGTGKTSMADEVGAEVEGSTFSKVISLVVSKPPDFKKLRREIARHLELELQDGGEEDQYKDQILNKISAFKEKRLLIILDDMWEKFDLTKELGIPSQHMNKCCTILITTRINDIYEKMDCQRKIILESLNDQEALSLFRVHSKCPSDLEGLAGDIVKHCHGVPVVLVAIASSLTCRPPRVWKEALTSLEIGYAIFNIAGNDDLKNAYNGLKLSYDNLENENAKKLFLLSSLFPEDSETPKEFFITMFQGVGNFGEVCDYLTRKRKMHDAMDELLRFSLLLNAEKECVKMHDLVHEVALLIGVEQGFQSISKPNQSVTEGSRYLYLKNYDFQNHFDGSNLEVLLVVLDCKDDVVVPDSFFTDMTKLKVLLLENASSYSQVSAPSLFSTVQTLHGIQSLQLTGVELSDLFTVGKCPNLETLWFLDCSIIESSVENVKLEKLRFLRIENCRIDKVNPFQLVEACPGLQELILLSNSYDGLEEGDTISQNVTFPELLIYQISYDEPKLSRYIEKYGHLSRCLQPGNYFTCGMSETTFKQIAKTPEYLILEKGDVGTEEKRNLIPDIVPLDDGGTTKLVILELNDLDDMECLIDAMDNRLHVKAFSNLVELSLFGMELKDALFNESCELPSLKVMIVQNCPKLRSIFYPSTFQSLLHLEELKIESCDALEWIVSDMSSEGEIAGYDGGDQNSYENLFPKFKILEISRCGNLEIILPILLGGGLMERITIQECEKLKHIFGDFKDSNVKLPSDMKMKLEGVRSLISIFKGYKNPISSSLQRPTSTTSRDNLKGKHPSSQTSSFSWAQVCCFKSRTINEEANDKEIPQEPLTLKEWIDTTTATLTRQLSLHFDHIKEVELVDLSLSSVSALLTISMASMISWEELKIRNAYGWKHLITSENDDHEDKRSCRSIFPKLTYLQIWDCQDLELLFFSSISIEVISLKSLSVQRTPLLTYIVGKYQHPHSISNQNQNDELLFHLPALENLWLEDVSKFISIGTKNYKVESPFLHNVCSDEEQLELKTTKEVHTSTNGIPLFHAAQSLSIQSFKQIRKIELVMCASIISLLALSTESCLLEDLTVKGCHQLKFIIEDQDIGGTRMHNSIFSKLKYLEVSWCKQLEYLFPANAFRSPIHLQSLKINCAPMLKYVFGRSENEDNLTQQYQDNQTRIEFPVLKTLSIRDVPKLVSIYSKNYYLVAPSLGSLDWAGLPKYTLGYSNGLLICWHTKQEETKVLEMMNLHTLKVENSEIEEMFHLTYMDIEKNEDQVEPLTVSLEMLLLRGLSELVNISVGPKHIICFHFLHMLDIEECKKLRAIFTKATVRSVPNLEYLHISDCEELVHIVEDDYESNADDHLCHEPCFPNLSVINVSNCDKLKYLLCITISGILPKLSQLAIRHASELEHVLIRKGEIQEMSLRDVLPQLSYLMFENLPILKSVCHGIDFQMMKDYSFVDDCPEFSFNETSTTELQVVDPKSADSKAEGEADKKLSLHLSSEQYINVGDTSTQQSTSDPISLSKVSIQTSPNLTSIPARDNSHASSKKFEEPKEEQGEPFLRPESTISSEQTLEASMPSSSLSPKASTRGTKESPSFIPSKPFENDDDKACDESDSLVDDDAQIYDKSHTHSTSSLEGVDNGNIKIADSHPRTTTTTTSVTTLQDESSKEPIIENLIPTILPRSPSETMNDFEEGSSISTDRHGRDMKAAISSLLAVGNDYKTSNHGKPSVPPNPIITSEKQFSEKLLAENLIPPKAEISPTQITMSTSSQSTDGRNYCNENVGTTNQPLHEVQRMQQVLRDLGSKLEIKNRELGIAHDKEAKAAQSAEMAYKGLEEALSRFNIAQQEHTNTRMHYSQLLQECQEILKQRDQCSEAIAARFKSFGS